MIAANKLMVLSPAFVPSRLLRGQAGAWHDQSVFTSFQDSAATTQQTAVEQPTGKRVDRSDSANHLVQATDAERPTLSAKINLLLNSDDLAAAEWDKAVGVSFSGGALTVDISQNYADVGQSFTSVAGEARTLTFSVKNGTSDFAYVIASDRTAHSDGQFFNVNSGAVGGDTGMAAGTNVTVTSASITASSVSGYWDCTITCTIANAGTYYATVGVADANNNTYGTAGKTILVARGQLVLGAATAGHQSVTTATSYTTSEVPAGDDFDGSNDSMTCATGGGGTSGFYYAEAYRVQGGAGANRTLFSDAGTNTGFRVRINSSNKLELAGGNNVAFVTAESAATLSLGTTYILEAWHDGASLCVQINGGAIASSVFPVATAGTAGFTVGKDNGAASSYANGRSYGRVYIKGGKPTDTDRQRVRKYLAAKAQVTI